MHMCLALTATDTKRMCMNRNNCENVSHVKINKNAIMSI